MYYCIQVLALNNLRGALHTWKPQWEKTEKLFTIRRRERMTSLDGTPLKAPFTHYSTNYRIKGL